MVSSCPQWGAPEPAAASAAPAAAAPAAAAAADEWSAVGGGDWGASATQGSTDWAAEA